MELQKFENRENLQFECKIISAKELLNKVYQGEQLPQDIRFLPIEEGGVFKYFDLKDLVGVLTNIESKFYSIAEANGEVAGLGELETDPRVENNLWIKFISVDPKYQGQGCATKLVEEIFQFAKNGGYSLEESFYSIEGEQKLKKLVHESAEKFEVKLILHK